MKSYQYKPGLLFGVLLILYILLAASCHTTKYIDRVEYLADSTAVHELKEQLRAVREDSAALQERISQLSENTVIFQDTGSTRIEYYESGNIKTVEGSLRSVTSKLAYHMDREAYWHSVADLLASREVKDSVSTRVEYVTVTKTVKRTVLPWWLLLIAAGVLIVGWRLGKIGKIRV